MEGLLCQHFCLKNGSMGELHWNMYNIIYETSRQSRFDAWYWMLGAGALGWPRGMVRGGRREEGSGWGTRVYLWWIHVDIWQNQYNIVKLKNKINNILIEKKWKQWMRVIYAHLSWYIHRIGRIAKQEEENYQWRWQMFHCISLYFWFRIDMFYL